MNVTQPVKGLEVRRFLSRAREVFVSMVPLLRARSPDWDAENEIAAALHFADEWLCAHLHREPPEPEAPPEIRALARAALAAHRLRQARRS
ncbi:MAG: hypothetical protein IPJ65_13705 [Archangiaceae bacterium]|nr:hypothetical protein [Archangiaceae bacterium]